MRSIRSFLICTTVAILLLLTGKDAVAVTDDLLEIGSTRLRVLFWTIYDCTLYSPSGDYQGVAPELTLAITYRRNIAASELVERTYDEWRKMELSSPRQADWREIMISLWPDVQEDDELTLRVDEHGFSRFYLNKRFIGAIADEDFTRQFLAIWLAPQTSYPQQRAALLGEKR